MTLITPPHSGQGGGSKSTVSPGADVGDLYLSARRRFASVGQERATEGELLRSVAIGEESEVANAMEAVRQYVEQEASHELVGLQTHGLDGAAVAIVLPGSGVMIVIAVLDAAVGDGDAMGVAPEIGEDLRRSAKRLLGVNDPIDAMRGGQTGGERIWIGQMREIAEEAEGFRVEGLLQAFDEKAAEEFW